MENTLPQIVPLGERAVLVTWGNEINKSINRKVHSISGMLRQLNIKGVVDIIPAYSSITILFDLPVFFSAYQQVPLNIIQLKLGEIFHHMKEEIPPIDSPVISIPVCYDAALGNDLKKLSSENSIAVEDIIQLHSSSTYYVYMLGFLPGFSYLGEVDDRIAFARKDKPVPVKAGSVAIAGKQTGIYPVDSPGGWNVVGFTPIKIFDTSKSNPCLLEPGATIVFRPIDIITFNNIQKQRPA
jgi:inhibitor of KinA